jgi:hypothetical protein
VSQSAPELGAYLLEMTRAIGNKCQSGGDRLLDPETWPHTVSSRAVRDGRMLEVRAAFEYHERDLTDTEREAML